MRRPGLAKASPERYPEARTICLTEDMDRLLMRVAARRGVTVAVLARQYLQRGLDSESAEMRAPPPNVVPLSVRRERKS